jgi:arylsulfatase A-like enzyme
MYDPDEIDLPPNYMPVHPFDNGELSIRDELLAEFPRTEAEIRRHIAEYYAMITHVDDAIGQVLDALEQAGKTEDTIIVFAGDNGLAVGQHGLMGKQNMYDHSVRVPLIFAGPGVPEGEQRDSFCYLLDIYPTLCELIGLDTPGTVEGKSLVAAMREGAAVRETLHFAYMDRMRAVRDRQYKLIEYVVDGHQRTQLFDLEADPWELNDLSGDPGYREHVDRLRGELRKWRTDYADDQPGQGATFWAGVDGK